MSQSGNYAVVNINNRASGGSARFDVYNNSIYKLYTASIYAGGHADFGYDTAGNEIMLGDFDGNTTTLYTFNLATQHLTKQLSPAVNGWSTHVSCHNLNRPGYCYISNLYIDDVPSENAYAYREVYAVKLDGSGTVERFSQDFKAAAPANNAYERTARAVPNRDGSLVLFASDWGNPTSSAIVYDYVAGRH